MAFDYRQEYHRYKQYYLNLKTLSKGPIAQSSITLLASLLTVALLGIFAIRPTLTTIARLTKEIQDKEKVERQLETKARALQQAQTNYEEVRSQIPLVEAALPRQPEFVRLEREVEYLALQHQVLLASGGFEGFVVAGEKESEKKPAGSSREPETIPAEPLQFTLTIAGTYSQIRSFISDLETLDRLVIINSTHFSKETEIEGAELQTTITGTAFYKNTFENGET